LTRGDTDEHLLDDTTIQRILAGHPLKRRQRHLGAVAADPRPPSTTSLDAVPARDAVRSAWCW